MEKGDIIVNKNSKVKYLILNKWYHIEKAKYIYTIREAYSLEAWSFNTIDLTNFYNLTEWRKQIIDDITKPE